MKCSRKDCPREAQNGFKSCEKCRASERKRAERNRPALREKGHNIYIALKRQVMEAYGGCRCACCGEDHLEFLSIDHIEGNGAEHRFKINGDPRNGKNFYYWLRDNNFPPGFRVLCMNCNFALGHNGFCPHRPDIRQPCKAGRPRKDLPTMSSFSVESLLKENSGSSTLGPEKG